jgi:hypothetical protein
MQHPKEIDMLKGITVAVSASLALAACETNSTNSISSTSAISVPSGAPLSAAEIPGVVQGGPYDVTIYDGEFEGTKGRTTWDFGAMRLTGSFRSPNGDTGTFERRLSIRDNQLCTQLADSSGPIECYRVYPYRGGFMEVTPLGDVHATSVPLETASATVGAPLGSVEIASLIQGRSFNVRTMSGESAGTTGAASYSADGRSVSGSFRTPAGEQGNYSLPISIQGNQICQGEAGQQQCHVIRAYQNGFAKMNADGSVQAIWLPA